MGLASASDLFLVPFFLVSAHAVLQNNLYPAGRSQESAQVAENDQATVYDSDLEAISTDFLAI